MQKFEFLPHTADIKFRAQGSTLGEAFENAVAAVASFIAKENKIAAARALTLNVAGTDKDNLFYKLIEEQISLLDSDNFVVTKAKITLLGNSLRVEFYGDDAFKYKGLDHIKSPTYAEISVKENSSHKWEVQMVLDV